MDSEFYSQLVQGIHSVNQFYGSHLFLQNNNRIV